MSKPKKIAFELIDPKATPTPEPYRLMEEMRAKHHPDIQSARIALAWRKGFKPDPDGRLILGRCIKASDLQRELVDFDFVILLNREVWDDPGFVRAKKLALIDHELCHADRAYDNDGPRCDSRGRPVWRIRKHDIEEFQCIVDRHGCYKRDLEAFAEVLMRRKNNPIFTSAESSGQ